MDRDLNLPCSPPTNVTDTSGQDSITKTAKFDTGKAGVWRSRDRSRNFPVAKLFHLVVVFLSRQMANLTVSTLALTGPRGRASSLARWSQSAELVVCDWRLSLCSLNAPTLLNIIEPTVARNAKLAGRLILGVASPEMLSDDL